MNPKKLGLAAVSVLAAGAIIGGTATLASADPSPTASASTSATPGSTDKGARQGHTHTAATDDEAQKVKDAIAAKDSTVTIEKVQKDEDGSFDADGTTPDDTKVRFDVSADYVTVSDAKTGGRGGKGGSASQSGQSGQSSTGTPTDANGTEGATTPAT